MLRPLQFITNAHPRSEACVDFDQNDSGIDAAQCPNQTSAADVPGSISIPPIPVEGTNRRKALHCCIECANATPRAKKGRLWFQKADALLDQSCGFRPPKELTWASLLQWNVFEQQDIIAEQAPVLFAVLSTISINKRLRRIIQEEAEASRPRPMKT